MSTPGTRNMLDAVSTTLVQLPVAALGALVNWSVVYSIWRLKSFRHSFGFLSANQAVADAIHSSAFLLYFCPMVLMDSSILKRFSHHCGYVILFCYEMSIHTHLVISLNRSFAAFAPLSYRRWFSGKNTQIIIVFLWFVTGSTTIAFYEYFCHLFYNDLAGFFFFTESPLCGFIGWYADFCKNACIVVLIVVIDVTTVLGVRSVSQKVISATSHETQNLNHARDVHFLRQTVFQGFVFLLELVTYFVFPRFLTSKWTVFFSTSFAWVAVHAVDGLITLICNPEIHQFVFSLGNVSQKQSSGAVSHVKSRTFH